MIASAAYLSSSVVVQQRPSTSLLQFCSASQSATHSCVCVRVGGGLLPSQIFLQLPSATANNSGTAQWRLEYYWSAASSHVLKQSRARFACRSTCTCDTGAWLERVVGPVLKEGTCVPAAFGACSFRPCLVGHQVGAGRICHAL